MTVANGPAGAFGLREEPSLVISAGPSDAVMCPGEGKPAATEMEMAKIGAIQARPDNPASAATGQAPQREPCPTMVLRDDMASIDHRWESPAELVITISGEVDMSNVDRLREKVEAAKADAQVVVFDLGGLDFIDSSGLSMLVSVADDVGRARLRSPSPFVRRVVELTGLAELLPTET